MDIGMISSIVSGEQEAIHGEFENRFGTAAVGGRTGSGTYLIP
jgi:hypothetical protein